MRLHLRSKPQTPDSKLYTTVVFVLLLVLAAVVFFVNYSDVPPTDCTIPEHLPEYLIVDPAIGLTLKPNYTNDKIVVVNGTKRIYYGSHHHNSKGMNNIEEFSLAKPKNISVRIAIFGDSFTCGPDVSVIFSTANLLKEMIPNSEVLNFCVPEAGIDTMFSRYVFEARNYSPDIVIFNLAGNTVRCNQSIGTVIDDMKRLTKQDNATFMAALIHTPDNPQEYDSLRQLLGRKNILFLDTGMYYFAGRSYYRNQSLTFIEGYTNQFTPVGHAIHAQGIKFTLRKAGIIPAAPADYFFANFEGADFMILMPDSYPFSPDARILYTFVEQKVAP